MRHFSGYPKLEVSGAVCGDGVFLLLYNLLISN